MCLTGCLPALCVMFRPRLACWPFPHSPRSSVSSIAPPCVSCLCSLPACSSHLTSRRFVPSCLSVGHVLLISSAHPACSRYARSSRSACSPRSSCRRAGRYAYRSHLVMRSARPLLGVLTVILNAVAMGTVGCGAFVPRFHELHLLSMGVVRISSSARRPLFFLLFRFLSSCLPVPRVDKRGDVGRFSRWLGHFFLWDFCAIGSLSYRACVIMYAVAMGTSE